MHNSATGSLFVLANHTKREVVIPREIGLEPQQRFHLGFDGSLSDALYVLTCNEWGQAGDFPNAGEACGRWAGDDVFVVGSTSESTYRSAFYSYTNVSDLVREAFTKLLDVEYEEIISGTLSIGWKRKDLF